jgi:hypothetical protein
VTTLTSAKTFKVKLPDHELIVRIHPDGLVQFRKPRERSWLDYHIGRAYTQAALLAADNLRMERSRRRRNE